MIFQRFRFYRRAWATVILAGALAACGARVAPVSNPPVMATAQPTATVTVPLAATVPAGTNSSTQASLPATGGVSARQAVLDAMRAVATAGPYHLKSTTTTGGATLTTTGEVSLPDHFHLVTNGEELLILGDKTYRKTNGRWVEFPIDIGKLLSGTIGTLTSEGEKGITDVQMLGPATVNGVPTVEYQFQQAAMSGGTGLTSTVRLWVDSQRGLPVQQQIDGVVGGQKTSTLQEISYDPGIKFPTP